MPEKYGLDFSINPYNLSRGIFSVPVFSGKAKISAKFAPFSFSQFDIGKEKIRLDKAMLIFGIQSKKNLTSFPSLSAGGEELKESLVETSQASPFTNAVYYDLPERLLPEGFELSGECLVQGGKHIRAVPLAADNTFTMDSEWPSPSFSGGWLPSKRDVSKSGFHAEWNVAGLSTIYPRSWLSSNAERYKSQSAEKVSASFIIPVDSYKKTERSVKYALLFLIVPFLAIFLCEIFSQTRVHPVQYVLMGLADVLFYLLLLSISEHLSFSRSYLIASLGVCLTTLLYAKAIFREFKWGIMLALVQLVSYVLLFGILQSEDYAFLIGSIGIFVLVALVMFLTRKVDWYAQSFRLQSENPAFEAKRPGKGNFFAKETAELPQPPDENKL